MRAWSILGALAYALPGCNVLLGFENLEATGGGSSSSSSTTSTSTTIGTAGGSGGATSSTDASDASSASVGGSSSSSTGGAPPAPPGTVVLSWVEHVTDSPTAVTAADQFVTAVTASAGRAYAATFLRGPTAWDASSLDDIEKTGSGAELAVLSRAASAQTPARVVTRTVSAPDSSTLVYRLRPNGSTIWATGSTTGAFLEQPAATTVVPAQGDAAVTGADLFVASLDATSETTLTKFETFRASGIDDKGQLQLAFGFQGGADLAFTPTTILVAGVFSDAFRFPAALGPSTLGKPCGSAECKPNGFIVELSADGGSLVRVGELEDKAPADATNGLQALTGVEFDSGTYFISGVTTVEAVYPGVVVTPSPSHPATGFVTRGGGAVPSWTWRAGTTAGLSSTEFVLGGPSGKPVVIVTFYYSGSGVLDSKPGTADVALPAPDVGYFNEVIVALDAITGARLWHHVLAREAAGGDGSVTALRAHALVRGDAVYALGSATGKLVDENGDLTALTDDGTHGYVVRIALDTGAVSGRALLGGGGDDADVWIADAAFDPTSASGDLFVGLNFSGKFVDGAGTALESPKPAFDGVLAKIASADLP